MSTKSIFRAKILELATNEEGVFIIGLAEDDSYEKVLIIQYTEELTQDDINRGWSKYYLEYSESNAGAYSCINKIVVGRSSVDFILNDEGKSFFELDEICVSIEFDKNDFVQLVDALKKVFNDDKEVVLMINDNTIK